jgi:hypothetical protein
LESGGAGAERGLAGRARGAVSAGISGGTGQSFFRGVGDADAATGDFMDGISRGTDAESATKLRGEPASEAGEIIHAGHALVAREAIG